MVVQVVRDGILFGADRNVTTDLCVGDDVLASGQTQHPKVLKWPNQRDSGRLRRQGDDHRRRVHR